MTYKEMTDLIGDPTIILDVDDICFLKDLLSDAFQNYDSGGQFTITLLRHKISEQFDAWKEKAKRHSKD